MYLLLILVAAANAELWSKAPEDGSLRQIHVIFRHGHREPVSEYPNDPNNNTTIWKNGPGHLTILGKQQAYHFGLNLRSRYSSLIPEHRAWNSIHAMSSDVTRTLMTAGAVLAGMIPPSIEDRWSDLNWQPAAIHTTPKKNDNLLASSPPCPRYRLIKHIKLETENQRLYDFVSKNSGKKIDSALDMLNLYTLLDIQLQAGLNLPLWAVSTFQDMKTESIKALRLSQNNTEIKRLRAGPLLHRVLFESEKPINLYSTHDTVIAGFLDALDIDFDEPPNFTSAIVIEHREIDGVMYADLLYRSRPSDKLIRYKWPGCTQRCSLAQLHTLLEDIFPYDWNEECLMLLGEDNPAANTTVVLKGRMKEEVLPGDIALAVIAMAFFIGFCIFWRRGKPRMEVVMNYTPIR